MKSLTAIACIFVTICFTFSDALQCFDCIFFDGYKNSDSSCDEKPKASLLKTCDDFPSPLEGEIPVCKTVTGIMNGHRIVQRECSRSFIESTGKCFSNDTIRIENRSTHNAYGCTCSTDQCNDASTHQFTNILLLAIVFPTTLYQFFIW